MYFYIALRPTFQLQQCLCFLRLLGAIHKAKPPQVCGLRGFWMKEIKFLNQITDQKLNCERTEITRSLSVTPELSESAEGFCASRITMLCANLVSA